MWFCHVSRFSGLAKIILRGEEKEEVDRRRGGKTTVRCEQGLTL